MRSAASAPGRMLVVVAHPDDESFGCGSLIAHAVARGHRVVVGCATLGEAGEPAPGYQLRGRSLAQCRHDELRAAAAVLGAHCADPLGLLDSGWDGEAPPGSLCAVAHDELVARVGALIRGEDPDIVATISGDDGHRDHRRLAAAVTEAFEEFAREGASLYQWCLPNELMRRWAEETARLRPDTAHLALALESLGTARQRFTTIIDTSAQLRVRRAAMAAHASQVSPYAGLSTELAEAFLTTDHLIRLTAPNPVQDVEHELTYQSR